MSIDTSLITWIAEAREPMGVLTHRAMMGGATLYLDGTIFAIATDDQLWFKSDADSDAVWDAAGCDRFTYDRKGETATMNYRRAPDDVYDDADAMQEWAEIALAAGLRGAAKKKPKKRAKPADS